VAARLLAAAQDSSRTEEAEIAQAALRQLYLALPQPAR
jgi:hypothetical protein